MKPGPVFLLNVSLSHSFSHICYRLRMYSAQSAEGIDMRKVKTLIVCTMLTAQYYIQTVAFASGSDAANLMQTVIKWVSRLIVIPGILMAVMGIIGFAQAHSEGDGPAQGKAIGKLAAGGMLFLVSFILYNSAQTLTTMIAH